jgi:hypothetical protein
LSIEAPSTCKKNPLRFLRSRSEIALVVMSARLGSVAGRLSVSQVTGAP